MDCTVLVLTVLLSFTDSLVDIDIDMQVALGFGNYQPVNGLSSTFITCISVMNVNIFLHIFNIKISKAVRCLWVPVFHSAARPRISMMLPDAIIVQVRVPITDGISVCKLCLIYD